MPFTYLSWSLRSAASRLLNRFLPTCGKATDELRIDRDYKRSPWYDAYLYDHDADDTDGIDPYADRP